MERLWSPWRQKYVAAARSPDGRCIFCEALERPESPESLVVHVAERSFVLLNLYPYNPGHLMIAPRAHVGTLDGAGVEPLVEMMSLLAASERVLRERYRPDGLNVGMNLGRVAGAGVPDHVHLHVVPRWAGDTNFMTVVGEVRVLSEDLRETARALRPLFAREAAKD